MNTDKLRVRLNEATAFRTMPKAKRHDCLMAQLHSQIQILILIQIPPHISVVGSYDGNLNLTPCSVKRSA